MAISNKMLAFAAVGFMIFAAFAVVCSNSDDSDAYPTGGVTITTNVADSEKAIKQTFTKAPERIIVGNVSCLELLLYFGLGDKIVGIYYNEDEIWSELQDEYKKVEDRLGSKYNLTGLMSQAVATELNPDLIMGYKSSFGTSSWAIGTTKYWNDLGCNVWSLNTQASSTAANIAGMSQDYQDLGNVFQITDKTDKYMQDFSKTIQSIKASGVKVGVFEYRADGTSYSNYGSSSFIGSTLEKIGADCIFAGDKNIPKAYLIASGDLQAAIIVAFGSNTPEATLNAFFNDSSLQDVTAVKNKDAIAIGLSQTYGGVQALSTLQQIADLLNEASEHEPSEGGSDDGSVNVLIGALVVLLAIIVVGAVFIVKKKA